MKKNSKKINTQIISMITLIAAILAALNDGSDLIIKLIDSGIFHHCIKIILILGQMM